jgi:hypothetical protein
MTLAPTYEAFKRETSGKTFFRKKKNPLSPWALDKGVRWFITTVKRNIVRVRRCVVYVVHGTFGY